MESGRPRWPGSPPESVTRPRPPSAASLCSAAVLAMSCWAVAPAAPGGSANAASGAADGEPATRRPRLPVRLAPARCHGCRGRRDGEPRVGRLLSGWRWTPGWGLSLAGLWSSLLVRRSWGPVHVGGLTLHPGPDAGSPAVAAAGSGCVGCCCGGGGSSCWCCCSGGSACCGCCCCCNCWACGVGAGGGGGTGGGGTYRCRFCTRVQVLHSVIRLLVFTPYEIASPVLHLRQLVPYYRNVTCGASHCMRSVESQSLRRPSGLSATCTHATRRTYS